MTIAAPTAAHAPLERQRSFRSDLAILILIALATVLVHQIVGNRYGFHRDELATLDDARHLAWGYVAYPPVTPFFGRISLELFGTSIRGFRFFANIALAIVVVLAGLIARGSVIHDRRTQASARGPDASGIARTTLNHAS